MAITRRQFVRTTGIGLTALLLPPGLVRRGWAQSATADHVLVAIFLRGGADGINLVVPQGDPHYSAGSLRPSLALGSDPQMALDSGNGGEGFFQLNPAMGPIKALYDSNELAIVHACGNTQSYSHFKAQDAMERVAPGSASSSEGWLHKAVDRLIHQDGPQGNAVSLSGVSLSSRKAASLTGTGPSQTTAFSSIEGFRFIGPHRAEREAALKDMYTALQVSGDPLRAKRLVHRAGGELFDALGELSSLGSQEPAGDYSQVNGGFARKLQDAARLVKNPALGVRAIALDFSGGSWDTHRDQKIRQENVGSQLAEGLRAFYEDLGAEKTRAVTLCMTEFGRTAFENGNAGTDHGWGTTMFVLGGAVQGGCVLCRADAQAPGTGIPAPNGQHWPGLAPGELHKQDTSKVWVSGYGPGERDLKATTDFRDVFGEVLEKHMGLGAAEVKSSVLEGYDYVPPGLFV